MDRVTQLIVCGFNLRKIQVTETRCWQNHSLSYTYITFILKRFGDATIYERCSHRKLDIQHNETDGGFGKQKFLQVEKVHISEDVKSMF